MPRRDPETGKFVSEDEFDDIEVYSFHSSHELGIEDSAESTTVETVELIDWDDIVDRVEEQAELLQANYTLIAAKNQGSEAITGRIVSEVSTADTPTVEVDEAIAGDGLTEFSDSLDMANPPMAVAFGPGVDARENAYEFGPEDLVAPTYHARDRLNVHFNGLFENQEDTARTVQVGLVGQYRVGLRSLR